MFFPIDAYSIGIIFRVNSLYVSYNSNVEYLTQNWRKPLEIVDNDGVKSVKIKLNGETFYIPTREYKNLLLDTSVVGFAS